MKKKTHSPPRLGLWLLSRLVDEDIEYEVLGDFEELYVDAVERRGSMAARRWFWAQVVRSIPPILLDSFYWSLIMLKNYAVIALRNFKKQKGYTFINVTGLAVGIASCLLIGLFVQDESRFDRYHEKADRIFRVTFDFETPDVERALAMVGPPVGPALENEFPEIEKSARFVERSLLLRRQDDPSIQYQEDNVLFADASALEMFSFSLYRGDLRSALAAPFSIVLNESAARRYFPNEDPIGKILMEDETAYTVTGLMRDVSPRSHFTFDMLVSWSTLEQTSPDFTSEFWALVVNTYVLLTDPGLAGALEAKLPAYLEGQIGDILQQEGHTYWLGVEPLTRIYLHSVHHSSLARRGDATSLYIFSGIALFILLIACINFINLATARAVSRAKEVGVRKAVGALKRQLAAQFFGETLFMIGVAMALAVVLTVLALPLFNAFSGKALSVNQLMSPVVWALFPLIFVLVGLLAGGYPALVLSRFQPVSVLRGAFQSGRQGAFLHRALVVFQFSLSIGLMIGTAVVFSQIEYMRGARLGYEKAGVLNIDFHGDSDVQARAEAVKQAFLRRADVSSASISGDIPGQGNLHASVAVEADDGTLRQEPWRYLSVDFDFINNYGMEIVAGRVFSPDFPADSSEAMIVNEAAVKDLGYDSPEEALGATFEHWEHAGQIVGVVRDFHLNSLQQEVEPVYILPSPGRYRYLSLRLDSDDLMATMPEIEALWHDLVPHRPFEYSFLNESLDRLYREEERFGGVVAVFAMLAILIACLGLFGLSSLTIRRRTREIGLRKVMGASTSSVMLLLTGEFARLVLIAFALTAPAAYVVIQRWLEGFAYHTSMNWTVFVAAGVLALAIACLSVGYQALKAAVTNPATVLQRE